MQVVAGTAIRAIRRSVSYVLLLMFELSLLQQMLVGGFDVLFCEDGVAVLKLRMFVAILIVSVAVIHLLAEVFLTMDDAVLELVAKAQNMGACEDSRVLIHFVAQVRQLLADLGDAVPLAVDLLEYV